MLSCCAYPKHRDLNSTIEKVRSRPVEERSIQGFCALHMVEDKLVFLLEEN